MTIDQIMEMQRILRRSRTPHPEMKRAVAEACTGFAEASRKYGVIPLSKTFNTGR
jgi:hypothetical protein